MMTHLYEHQRTLFSLPVQVPPREMLIEDASTTVLPGRHWIITLYTMMKVEVLQGLHGPGARGPCADPS